MIREDIDNLIKIALLEGEKELADKLWPVTYAASALEFLYTAGGVLIEKMDTIKSQIVKEKSLKILEEIRNQLK